MFKKVFSGLVLSASMVACSDIAGPDGQSPLIAPSEASQAIAYKLPVVGGLVSDTTSQVITIDGGASKTYYFGGHSLYVQSNSICKGPVGGGTCSTYGKGQYVKVTMKWWKDSQGRPVISVTPVLNFRADRPARLNVAAPGQPLSGLRQSLSSGDGADAPDLSMLLTMFSGYNVWA